MVSVLDVGLLKSFSTIIPMVLIFVIIYAILEKTKLLGENVKNINAVVAISVALLSLLSKSLLTIINIMAPWFVAVILFVILLVLVYMSLGLKEETLAEFVKEDMTVKWAIFGVGLFIFLAALGIVFGQNIGPYLGGAGQNNLSGTATPAYISNITATVFHPKVLGFGLIMIIAVFAIALLTSSEKP